MKVTKISKLAILLLSISTANFATAQITGSAGADPAESCGFITSHIKAKSWMTDKALDPKFENDPRFSGVHPAHDDHNRICGTVLNSGGGTTTLAFGEQAIGTDLSSREYYLPIGAGWALSGHRAKSAEVICHALGYQRGALSYEVKLSEDTCANAFYGYFKGGMCGLRTRVFSQITCLE